MLNFLSNAIKFTYQGKSIQVRVILRDIQLINEAHDDLDQIDSGSSQDQIIQYVKFSLEIEDAGVGISPQNLKNLFIDFGKLQEHENLNPQGTGLGLSICKKIIDQMGSEISVTSELGIGTTFKIDICSKIKI